MGTDYKKKYEEAAQLAKEWFEDKTTKQKEKVLLEAMFPQLKESDDERIRKDIIAYMRYERKSAKEEIENRFIPWLEKQGEPQPYKGNSDTMRKNLIKAFKSVGGNYWGGLDVRDILHWLESKDAIELEKQGEQKSADKVEPKFKVGDWVAIESEIGLSTPLQIVDMDDNFYRVEDTNGSSGVPKIDYLDRHYHLWTTQDAKDGDVLVDEDNNIGIYKEIEGIYWHSYIYLGCDNRLYGFSIGGSHMQNNTKPATKDQCDLLFQKMHEAGYEWDAEKKKLRKVEQKLAWSKEDITNYSKVLFILQTLTFPTDNERRELVTWLEKQCEQKPIEENKGNIGKTSPKWSEEDENMRESTIDVLVNNTMSGSEGDKVYSKEIDWLKSLKPQPKQEWSDEDESCYSAILDVVNNDLGLIHTHRYWFKNIKYRIKPQNRWKPTSEQMDNLEYAINMVDKCCENSLQSLYNDLKKL